jgi:hypothetical protein
MLRGWTAKGILGGGVSYMFPKTLYLGDIFQYKKFLCWLSAGDLVGKNEQILV